jgi:hypothetical protein
MITAEHSYFNFLMEYSRAARAHSVGVMPERTPVDRACLLSLRERAEAPGGQSAAVALGVADGDLDGQPRPPAHGGVQHIIQCIWPAAC